MSSDIARSVIDALRKRVAKLQRENAELREDKEHLRGQLHEANRLLVAFAPESAHAAIEAARNSARAAPSSD